VKRSPRDIRDTHQRSGKPSELKTFSRCRGAYPTEHLSIPTAAMLYSGRTTSSGADQSDWAAKGSPTSQSLWEFELVAQWDT